MTHSTLRLYGYGITVFFASAALMIMEIVAARLLAPYVGVSLYTWTTLIGVVLAGLSLGNWLGGVWADRGAGTHEAGLTLGLSSVLCMMSLLLLTWLAPLLQTQQINLILASLSYVGTMFFLPALFLGVVTPLLTALALPLHEKTGHVLGGMHAVATLGSIAGTFVAGYWLVQYFGSRQVLIGTSVGLLLLALPLLFNARKMMLVLLLLMLLVVGITHWRDGFADPCDRESNYFCIRVVDEELPPESGFARGLVLDHLVHGTNHREDPQLLLAPYVHLMDELVRFYYDEQQRATLNWFFAGGGAYTQPRAVLAATPEAGVHVAELDPQVTLAATEELFVDTQGMDIVHQDARLALQHYPLASFDVVVGDVFHDVSIPYHLVTREFFQLVKSRMKADGIYLMNVVDAFPDPRLVKSLMRTLQSEFAHVYVWLDEIPQQPQRMTYVISASDLYQAPYALQAQNGLNRQWLQINDPLQESGMPLEQLPVLSDNYAPVDRLLDDLWFGKLGI